MGLLLTLSTLYVPPPVRKRKLEMLFTATADAFQTTRPSTRGLSFDDGLRVYAQFTREQAEKAIQQGDGAVVRPRLFENAYRIGRQLKADFRVNSTEVMRMGALIYRILGIDFEGEPGGNIVIRRCFFSAYYSSPVCRVISSLDEGLLVGLAGGGRLSFSQRITEGNECCRAHLQTDRTPE
jgi:hypothetical protein